MAFCPLINTPSRVKLSIPPFHSSSDSYTAAAARETTGPPMVVATVAAAAAAQWSFLAQWTRSRAFTEDGRDTLHM